MSRPGIYRRRIRTAVAGGTIRADLEDDPHRLALSIEHDGQGVTAITGKPLRTPWSRCPEAAGRLDRLIGMPLDPNPLAVYDHTAGQHQCTHLFDLAGLALAHAARGIAARQYDAEVTVPADTAPREARLLRDGELVLRWVVDQAMISGPAPFAGRDVRRLLSWAKTACETVDEFEAIVVLRRAVHISDSRLVDLDTIPAAGAIARYSGACYVFQPDKAAQSVRNLGSTLDFTTSPDLLLRDVD